MSSLTTKRLIEAQQFYADHENFAVVPDQGGTPEHFCEFVDNKAVPLGFTAINALQRARADVIRVEVASDACNAQRIALEHAFKDYDLENIL